MNKKELEEYLGFKTESVYGTAKDSFNKNYNHTWESEKMTLCTICNKTKINCECNLGDAIDTTSREVKEDNIILLPWGCL